MKWSLSFCFAMAATLTVVCASLLPAEEQIWFRIQVLEIDAARLKAETNAENLGEFLRAKDMHLAGFPPGSPYTLLSDTNKLMPKLDDLRNRRIAKVLAEPTLVAHSGRPVSFFSGGEIPIPANQPEEGQPARVEYREVGTKFNALATIKSDREIALECRFELSQLNGQTPSGQPLIRVRRMDLAADVPTGQSLCLVQNCESADDRMRRKQTVVMVTPEAATPIEVHPLPAAPNHGERNPHPLRRPVWRQALEVTIETAPESPENKRLGYLSVAARGLRQVGMDELARQVDAHADVVRPDEPATSQPRRTPIAAPQPIPDELQELSEEVRQLRADIDRLNDLLEARSRKSAAHIELGR